MKKTFTFKAHDSNITKTKTRFITPSQGTKEQKPFKESDLFDTLLNIAEFKKIETKTKQNIKQTKTNNPTTTQSPNTDLFTQLSQPEYPDHSYNIINTFLFPESSNTSFLCSETQHTPTHSYHKVYTDKLLKPETFSPDIFKSFTFKDKVKDLICKAMSINNDSLCNENIQYQCNKSNEDIIIHEDTDYIFDMCLNTNINFVSKIKKGKDRSLDIHRYKKFDNVNNNNENKLIDSYDNSNNTTDLNNKSKTFIYEHENQISSYHTLTEIEEKERFGYYNDENNDLDIEAYHYFIQLTKNQNNPLLRNKLKLIVKSLTYYDPILNQSLIDNQTKNKLFQYWKKQYIKAIELCLDEQKKHKEEQYKRKLKQEKRKSRNSITTTQHNQVLSVVGNSELDDYWLSNREMLAKNLHKTKGAVGHSSNTNYLRHNITTRRNSSNFKKGNLNEVKSNFGVSDRRGSKYMMLNRNGRSSSNSLNKFNNNNNSSGLNGMSLSKGKRKGYKCSSLGNYSREKSYKKVNNVEKEENNKKENNNVKKKKGVTPRVLFKI
jgi:hypothetical protein